MSCGSVNVPLTVQDGGTELHYDNHLSDNDFIIILIINTYLSHIYITAHHPSNDNMVSHGLLHSTIYEVVLSSKRVNDIPLVSSWECHQCRYQ